MWFSSSAGVSTSLSSIKSTSSACSTSASTKCPMRTLAITGIVTVAMISRITLIDAMRATPPSLRMSEGTRSSAITAQAPAFSAIFACSALVTSMITPPFSISARPTFTRHSLEPLLPLPLPFTFLASISLLLSTLEFPGGCCSAKIRSPRHNHHKSRSPSCQNFTGLIANLAGHEQVSSLLFRLASLNNNFPLHAYRFQVFDRQFGRYRPRLAEPAYLAHGFIEQRRNDSAMRESSASLIPFAQHKPPHDLTLGIVLFERQLHPARIVPAAAETPIRRVRLQPDDFAQSVASLALLSSLFLYFPTSLFLYVISSHQRNSAPFRPSHAALPLAHLDL